MLRTFAFKLIFRFTNNLSLRFWWRLLLWLVWPHWSIVTVLCTTLCPLSWFSVGHSTVWIFRKSAFKIHFSIPQTISRFSFDVFLTLQVGHSQKYKLKFTSLFRALFVVLLLLGLMDLLALFTDCASFVAFRLLLRGFSPVAKDRSFQNAATHLWNNFPPSLRSYPAILPPVAFSYPQLPLSRIQFNFRCQTNPFNLLPILASSNLPPPFFYFNMLACNLKHDRAPWIHRCYRFSWRYINVNTYLFNTYCWTVTVPSYCLRKHRWYFQYCLLTSSPRRTASILRWNRHQKWHDPTSASWNSASIARWNPHEK